MDTQDKQIAMRLTGPGISPGLVRSKDLAEVIAALEEMVAAIVVDEEPSLSLEQIRVGLQRIDDGSLNLTFEPNLKPQTLPATERAAASIAGGTIGALPPKARQAISTIHKFTKNYDAAAEIWTLNGTGSRLATIDASTTIPEATFIVGITDIYGEVTRAGGANKDKPSVQFRLHDGTLLYCSASAEVAQLVAGRLYQEVALRGHATWNFETLKIESFRIEELLDYSPTIVTQAFDELRKVMGNFADSINDVDEFVREMREETAQ